MILRAVCLLVLMVPLEASHARPETPVADLAVDIQSSHEVGVVVTANESADVSPAETAETRVYQTKVEWRALSGTLLSMNGGVDGIRQESNSMLPPEGLEEDAVITIHLFSYEPSGRRRFVRSKRLGWSVSSDGGSFVPVETVLEGSDAVQYRVGSVGYVAGRVIDPGVRSSRVVRDDKRASDTPLRSVPSRSTSDDTGATSPTDTAQREVRR